MCNISLVPSDADTSPYARGFRISQIDGYSQEMFDLINQAFDDGDPRAIYSVATWHLYGTGRKKNYKKAAALLERAALAGIGVAAYNLAVSYEKGKGVPRDKRKAFAFYTCAALMGKEGAKTEVERCYFYGIGVRKNLKIYNILKKIKP